LRISGDKGRLRQLLHNLVKLGLAIVKKIVEEHGGWIQLEAPVDGGARIVIRLPIAHDDVESAAPPSLPAMPSNTDQGGAG